MDEKQIIGLYILVHSVDYVVVKLVNGLDFLDMSIADTAKEQAKRFSVRD
jgi:hypothetical protein